MNDVSLEQYAAVKAAIADAFPLDEALAVESIEEAAWKKAHREWAEKLVTDEATFTSYTAELQRAEDRLRREVFPLETEPRAWAAFLFAYGARPADEMTAETGLGLPDLSRLNRHWQKRCWGDVSITDRLTEHRREVEALPDAKSALPALRIGPRTLRGSKEPPPTPEATGGPPSSASGARMPIDVYATLIAELSRWPKQEERILAKHGISRFELSALESEWEARFVRSPSTRLDFRRLLAHQRNRLLAQTAPPAEAPAPPSRRGRKRGVATASPEEVAHTMRSPISSPDAAPAPVAVPRPDAKTTTTAGGKPRRAGTAEVQTVTPRPNLPFSPGPPVKPPRRFVTQLPGQKGKTADVATQARRPATMPFEVPRERAKPAARPVAPTQDVTIGNAEPKTLPFQVKASPGTADAIPKAGTPFTIEHYASLCTELGLWPNLAPEILGRYGLTPADKAALDLRLKAEMATDRALYQRWYAASEKYLSWLLTNTPPGKDPKG